MGPDQAATKPLTRRERFWAVVVGIALSVLVFASLKFAREAGWFDGWGSKIFIAVVVWVLIGRPIMILLRWFFGGR